MHFQHVPVCSSTFPVCSSTPLNRRNLAQPLPSSTRRIGCLRRALASRELKGGNCVHRSHLPPTVCLVLSKSNALVFCSSLELKVPTYVSKLAGKLAICPPCSRSCVSLASILSMVMSLSMFGPPSSFSFSLDGGPLYMNSI